MADPVADSLIEAEENRLAEFLAGAKDPLSPMCPKKREQQQQQQQVIIFRLFLILYQHTKASAFVSQKNFVRISLGSFEP